MKEQMRKKINGVLYDTASSSLIIDSESMTALSGRFSIRLFRTPDGQWFLTIEPGNIDSRQQYSCIEPETALCWLEKHSFNRQIREYFGISDNRLQPERQILVAEWKSPNSTTSPSFYLPSQTDQTNHQLSLLSNHSIQGLSSNLQT